MRNTKGNIAVLLVAKRLLNGAGIVSLVNSSCVLTISSYLFIACHYLICAIISRRCESFVNSFLMIRLYFSERYMQNKGLEIALRMGQTLIHKQGLHVSLCTVNVRALGR